MKRFTDFAFAIVIYSVFVTAPAQAYLDSATINIILQAVTGVFASALLFGKVYWARFTGFFRRGRTSAPASGDNQKA
ncbi:hypothetical protein RCO27_14880 [Sphingosinicella sp. LHD-64]|uniref:hypothetical protein n=1 Tax=Sphingosinicella sp. LHD-64 TaxID=3072139 RepID=UPI00280E5B78|nr:hypothetical protein [Sphingosinicella sp. LHD-64]MDQ8757513.1 hypothetical protein [Sphingosinicella sp. LHD-64]